MQLFTNWSKKAGETAEVQSSAALDKKSEPISAKTLARTFEALANPNITSAEEVIKFGADDTNDPFKMKPITESGKQELADKIQAKTAPLGIAINNTSATLTQNVQLDTLMDDGNQYAFQIPFNGKSEYLVIIPSVNTKSIDVEIGGRSENAKITMNVLVRELKAKFPQQQNPQQGQQDQLLLQQQNGQLQQQNRQLQQQLQQQQPVHQQQQHEQFQQLSVHPQQQINAEDSNAKYNKSSSSSDEDVQ